LIPASKNLHTPDLTDHCHSHHKHPGQIKKIPDVPKENWLLLQADGSRMLIVQGRKTYRRRNERNYRGP
jgi:hypothetical protein